MILMDEAEQNFDDYLSEFNKLVPFDSEICPVCGIKISDEVSVNESPFVDLISLNEEKTVNYVCEILRKHEVAFKVFKDLDKFSMKTIKYKFRIVVLMCDLQTASELITKNPIQIEPG